MSPFVLGTGHPLPFALAVLLTFVLTPPVTWLQRWIGRVPAVLFAVTLVFAALGLVGWGLSRQMDDLARDLPGYRANIRTKIADVRGASRGGTVAFWAWLWGPLGLLMASPLTVCLVVIGKHVPGLAFVGTLMADTMALAPEYGYYLGGLLELPRLQAQETADAAGLAALAPSVGRGSA